MLEHGLQCIYHDLIWRPASIDKSEQYDTSLNILFHLTQV